VLSTDAFNFDVNILTVGKNKRRKYKFINYVAMFRIIWDSKTTDLENGGFPWVALRLADVYGPRDTTTRWSLYQSWYTSKK
jgi:hypothetical protein